MTASRTSRYLDEGGSFQQVITKYIGLGKKFVDVQLRGWNLEFVYDDHHVRMVQLCIDNVAYNASTGYVTFTVRGNFKDKNGDDDFHWQVWYTILALS